MPGESESLAEVLSMVPSGNTDAGRSVLRATGLSWAEGAVDDRLAVAAAAVATGVGCRSGSRHCSAYSATAAASRVGATVAAAAEALLAV